MKKLILFSFIFTSLMITGCVMTSGTMSTTTTTTIVRHPNPTFGDLDNYGTWENIPDYGTVWKPYDESNWQPYADGQWVWTDQGWMWDSNEPYGWIVYHYGYWQFTDFDGWFWVPSYDWAPARVRWYHSNGYVGWAPAPPPTVTQTVIYNDVYVNRVWVVVPDQNFAGQNAARYRNRSYVPGAQVLRSNDGGRAPEIRDIEEVSHRTINPVQPTREQVNAGNRQLTRVRIQNNNTPVSPSTIRNQPAPVRTPAANSPTVNPQKPASNAPEINDRRPVNNSVQKQPVERNNPPARQIDNSGSTQKGKAQNNRGTNNPNLRNAGRTNNANQRNPARSDSLRKQNGAPKQPVAAPGRDKKDNTDKKDDQKGRAEDGK